MRRTSKKVSWMGSYGDNSDDPFAGSVIPEHPVCGWSSLLGISLEHFFFIRTLQAQILMGLKSGMPGICSQELDCLFYGFITLILSGVFFESIKILERLAGEEKSKQKSCPYRDLRSTAETLPAAASASPRLTETRASLLVNNQAS